MMKKLLALLLFVSLLALSAGARVGGGGGYSSSRSSSSSSRSSSSSSGGYRSSGSGYRSSGGTYSTGRSYSTGGTYSSGGYSSSGDSDGGLWGLLILLIITAMFVAVAVSLMLMARHMMGPVRRYQTPENDGDRPPLPDPLAEIKQIDGNFSEPAFLAFGHLLYTRFHEARGKRQLDQLGPYFSKSIIDFADSSSTQNKLTEVSEVLVGASRFLPLSLPTRLENNQIGVKVEFESTLTETTSQGAREYYTAEHWTFAKQRGVLSKAPEDMLILACPACGHSGQLQPDGRCPYCDKVVNRGNFQWTVVDRQVVTKDAKPPIKFDSDGQEAGTDLPTVFQRNLEAERRAFLGRHPDFNWDEFKKRALAIFQNLQQAWSTLDYDKARPFEADVLFDTHRYWIERYRSQGLRNCLEDITVEKLVPCRIERDAFYERITLRIFAHMRDWMVNRSGAVVSGNPKKIRRFTEYWTFIRRVGSQTKTSSDLNNCPHCGGPLKISQTGICEYCQAKVTSGEFDWILSSIEQDESYGQAA